MKYAFVRDHRELFAIGVMCAVLRVSRSGFYRWLREPIGRRTRRREILLARIRDVHERSRGTYGSPRIRKELAAEGAGAAPCRNTVARVMRMHGIKGIPRRKFRPTTTRAAGHGAAADLVRRQFTVQRPDQVWVGDITYVPTGEGYLYLAGVMDLCSRRIVGWSMGIRMATQLVIDALTMAVRQRRPSPGLIFHSDRGSQYTSKAYLRLLGRHGIRASMGRAGTCYDNAPAESFWSTLKAELLHQKTFAARGQARAAIFEYIEVFYSRARLHSSLGYKSPERFEIDWART